LDEIIYLYELTFSNAIFLAKFNLNWVTSYTRSSLLFIENKLCIIYVIKINHCIPTKNESVSLYYYLLLSMFYDIFILLLKYIILLLVPIMIVSFHFEKKTLFLLYFIPIFNYYDKIDFKNVIAYRKIYYMVRKSFKFKFLFEYVISSKFKYSNYTKVYNIKIVLLV